MYGFQDGAKVIFSIGNIFTASVNDASQLREMDGEWDEDSIAFRVLNKTKKEVIGEITGFFYPVKNWKIKRWGITFRRIKYGCPGIDFGLRFPSFTISGYWMLGNPADYDLFNP